MCKFKGNNEICSDFTHSHVTLIIRDTKMLHSVRGGLVFCLRCRVKGVTADQEESLLQQLTEITRVMQEGQLVENMAPEKKTEDDWEGTRTPHAHGVCFIM